MEVIASPLVALSLLIATVASYAALDVAARVVTTRGWMSVYWLAAGAGAMGIGIWSMHFIGMLAFRLPIPMAYEPKVTIASLFIGIGVAAFALYVVSRNTLGAPRTRARRVHDGAGNCSHALPRYGRTRDRPGDSLQLFCRGRVACHRDHRVLCGVVACVRVALGNRVQRPP